MKPDAVITAGGRVDGEFARLIGTRVKALARINGATMLDRTIAALRDAGVERIAVIGGHEVYAACARSVEKVLAEHESGAENVRTALNAWDSRSTLLYATSDMPFITASAVGAFLSAAPSQAVALPLTEWADFNARFPGAPQFGVCLGPDKVVNGGVFLMPASAIPPIEALALRFFEARKSVFKMARLAGPAVLARFVIRRLRVAHLEWRASAMLGLPAVAVRHAPPELAYDVDLQAEYQYAAQHAAR